MSRAGTAIASFGAGVLVTILLLWVFVGYPDVEHVPVPIHEARLVDAENQRVELIVGSCNGAPRATVSQGSEYIEVEVKAFRFKRDQDDCQDITEVFLNQAGLDPLPTALLDAHSNEIIQIRITDG